MLYLDATSEAKTSSLVKPSTAWKPLPSPALDPSISRSILGRTFTSWAASAVPLNRSSAPGMRLFLLIPASCSALVAPLKFLKTFNCALVAVEAFPLSPSSKFALALARATPSEAIVPSMSLESPFIAAAKESRLFFVREVAALSLAIAAEDCLVALVVFASSLASTPISETKSCCSEVVYPTLLASSCHFTGSATASSKAPDVTASLRIFWNIKPERSPAAFTSGLLESPSLANLAATVLITPDVS